MLTISTENFPKVLEALYSIEGRLSNLRPALLEIGHDLAESTRMRFAAGQAPDGSTWVPRSITTLEIYARKGVRPGVKPLTGETSRLSSSIGYQTEGENAVRIGTDTIYGGTHQFGARKGAYGTTRRGGPIPWGDIPARPYLGVSDQDEQTIMDIIASYLQP